MKYDLFGFSVSYMEAKWSRAIVKLDDWTLLALNVYLTTRVGNNNADSKKKS